MSIFKFAIFKRFPGLIAKVADADYGNMSVRYGSWPQVRQNRARFFADLGVPEEKVVATSLVHGHKILEVTQAHRGRGISAPETSLEGDVLVTGERDTYLFFVVADCLALFCFDPVKQVCALAHAGWRGVDQEVPRLTIEYMVKTHNCRAGDIVVGMSPALQCESSQSEDIQQKDHPAWRPYIKAQSDGERKIYCVDWTGFAYDQLMRAGIKEENIERSEVDTKVDRRFFSHRRSAQTGEPEARFGCLIGYAPRP